MSAAIYIETFQYNGSPVRCALINNEFWFRGEDVAILLGYYSGRQAVRDIVDDDDKQTLGMLVASYGEDFVPDLDRNELRDFFVSLCGVAYLVHESRWQDANLVKRWICRDIVPRLRDKASNASFWYRNAPAVPYPQNHDDDDDDNDSDESDDDGNDNDPLLGNIQVDAEKSIEFGIRDPIIEHVRDFYPDAEIIFGVRSKSVGRAPRDSVLERVAGGCYGATQVAKRLC